jgi:7,8-dihydropterin-6-yl-methyl-4-(beta-D-ribofuranosyl)aminobenzene 5'-phosphate synthase
MGGFHLRGQSEPALQSTLHTLRELSVRKVAPSHCTGEEAVALFREARGSDFIDGGCGAVIDVP